MDDQKDLDAIYEEAFARAKARESLNARRFWQSLQGDAKPSNLGNTNLVNESNSMLQGPNDPTIAAAAAITTIKRSASANTAMPAPEAIMTLPKIPKRVSADHTPTSAPFSGRTYAIRPVNNYERARQDFSESSSNHLVAEAPLMPSSTADTEEVNLNSNVLMNFDIAPLPDWYRQIDTRQLRQNLGDDGQFLMRLRYAVSACLRSTAQQRANKIEEIRKILHVIEHLRLKEWIIKRTKIIDASKDVGGLPSLFQTHQNGFVFPIDIRLDARALYLKLCRCDLDPDILRGVSNMSGKSRRSWKLDPGYTNRISAKFFGSGDLVSGQWWPLRIAALRDGAHGSLEAGIFGNKELGGAMAIVVAGAYSEDKDYGDRIEYCGTKANQYAPEPTKDTQLLFRNITSRKPVRVLRTSKLPISNVYRPVQGIRFDGTYTVESYELLNEESQFYRFKLLREPNQPPIRYKGSMAKPTAQDVEAFEQHKWLTSGQME